MWNRLILICYLLKVQLNSRSHHSSSLFGKEQLWHIAINISFCVPRKKESHEVSKTLNVIKWRRFISDLLFLFHFKQCTLNESNQMNGKNLNKSVYHSRLRWLILDLSGASVSRRSNWGGRRWGRGMWYLKYRIRQWWRGSYHVFHTSSNQDAMGKSIITLLKTLSKHNALPVAS